MMPPRRGLLAALAILIGLAAPLAHAQVWDTCKHPRNPHYAIDCGEALFSEDPLHFTFSSMPPGNGFALGVVLEQNSHYVSPFALPQTAHVVAGGDAAPAQPDASTASLHRLGSLWSADGRLAGIASFNGSWVTTGTLTLMPAGYHDDSRTDRDGQDVQCNRLGPASPHFHLCTRKVFGLHIEATHRSLKTISFYGTGPQSPSIKHTFAQDDTYGSVSASLPIQDWLTATSGFEYRQTNLPSTASDPLSVSQNFTPAALPGLSSQPGYAHSHVGLAFQPVLYIDPRTDDLENNKTGPQFKADHIVTFYNTIEYHWFGARGGSTYSFQQFIADSDQNVQLALITRHNKQVFEITNPISRLYYRFLAHACDEIGLDWSKPKDFVLKPRQQCALGTLDLRSHLVASRTGPASTIPFYLQPTIGGSDIDSRVSLRAYPNYRFRAPDAFFGQTEYSLRIWKPLGLLLFYDAGTVGQTFSSLSFAHLRQDAGFGTTVSLQGNVIVQGYLAFGAGHGPTFGYNFAKLF